MSVLFFGQQDKHSPQHHFGWFAVSIFVLAVTVLSLAGCSSLSHDQSVVRVILFKGTKAVSTGSGFVVAPGGYIVTNHHVIDSAKTNKSFDIKVYTEGEKTIGYVASVSWSSRDFDLAILRAPDLSAPALTVNKGNLEKKDRVTAIGFPGTADAIDAKGDATFISTLTTGQISRVVKTDWHGSGQRVRVVQHTAAINSGNSGGPLLNACGEVIAVNTSIARSKLEKTSNGTISVDVGHATSFSSHAEELARFLKIRKIPATITSGRCNPRLRNIYLVASLAMTGFMALAALFFSLRNVPALQRRVPGLTRLSGGSPPATPHNRAGQGPIAGTMLDDDNDYFLVPKGGSERGTEMRLSSERAGTSGIVIGRQPQDGIIVDDVAASREHIRITSSGKKPYTYYIEDLGSKNGTKVNDRPVTAGEPPAIIRSGDKIRFGSRAYEFINKTDFYSSRRTSGPVGEQWVLTGRDPETGHTISIAFDDSHFKSAGNQLILGRDGDFCDFVISNPTISNRGHARISRVGSDLFVTDMGATNGVKVDGIKLRQNGSPTKLAQGSSLQLGAITLRVEKNI